MADGTTLGTAYVQIIPSTEGISGNLSAALGDAGDSAGKVSGKSFGSSFSSALGTVAKTSIGAVTAVGTGVAALTKGFMDSASSVAQYGDGIDKMSQKLGISAEAYQEWDAVLQHSGTSMSAMKPAMKSLANAAAEGSDAFEKLGISTEEAAKMSREDLFAATITGLQNITDENERAALAQDLLGKSSMELGALLNTSAEDTQAMRDRVHELGGVLSDEAVKSAAAFQDSLQDMTTAFDGIKRNITADFLPSITGVMDGITDILTGDTDAGLQKISASVSTLIGNLTSMLPQIMEVARGIVTGFGQAIIQNLPQIIETGTQIVMELVNGLIQALPEILTAATEAIITLANGISDSLPTLIPTMVDVVLTMVDGLIQNAPQLVEAALQLMMGLAEGLINAIPVIIERLPEIIENIVTSLIDMAPKVADAGVQLLTSLVTNMPQIISKIVSTIPSIISNIVKAFAQGVPQLVSAGVNLIRGIGQGIIKGAVDVINSARQVCSDIVNSITSFFQISSPSKLMEGFGRFLDQGIAGGIDDEADAPVRSMIRVSKDISDAFAPTISADAIRTTGFEYQPQSEMTALGRVSRTASVNRPLTVILQLDRQILGKAVYQLNNEEEQRVGVQLAGGYGI